MENRRVSALRKIWRSFLIFWMSFLPKYAQLNFALQLIKKDVLKIIDKEKTELFIGERGTLQAQIYWDAFIEMVKLLYIEGDNKACAKSFSLMATILDNQRFNWYLFEVSGMLSKHHPRFIEYMDEIRGKKQNA